jgi:hypothetical protein
VSILQRQLGKRPSLMPAERVALVLSSLHLARHRLLGSLMVVAPATVVGWHRRIATRRICFWNVTTSPDEAWVAQQFRNLSVVSEDLPTQLIRGRDSKYSSHADALLDDPTPSFSSSRPTSSATTSSRSSLHATQPDYPRESRQSAAP